MGTALRFVVGFAGILCTLLGLVTVGPALLGMTALPEDSDFPGGLASVIVLQLIAGSWPLALGVYLLRKAMKAGTARLDMADGTTNVAGPPVATSSATTPVVANTPVSEPEPAFDVPTPVAPAAPVAPATLPDVPVRPRRAWLAGFGLLVTLPGLLILLVAGVEIAIGSLPNDQTDWGATIFILISGVIPLLVGLRLAYAGDREIFRRLAFDLRRALSSLREPSRVKRLIRTSAGFALVTAAISLPIMAIWREGSPLIALVGTTLFSIVDPVFNASRRSWFVGAFISIPIWIVLFMTLAQTAEAIAPMREGAMVFILPMMAYPAALGLSGLARFWRWAVRRSNPEALS